VELKIVCESTMKRRGTRQDAADGNPKALPMHNAAPSYKEKELRTTRTVILCRFRLMLHKSVKLLPCSESRRI
jgi:hypothetical protein